MKFSEKPGPRSRREFLKQAGSMGALLCLATSRLFSQHKTNAGVAAKIEHDFKFSTVSVKHIPELKAWMDRLEKARRLSNHKTWRGYINSFQYSLPPALPKAQSLIIMAAPLKISKIVFNCAGKKNAVMIPAGYVDDGLRLADYQNMLFNKSIVSKGGKLELARLPLKQLAVRSGLAEYGKNNITFVEGYGSFYQLLAFYSEERLENHWGRLKMLRLCKGCSICMKDCPTQAIRENDFVIDPEKCISLYNELPDPIPAWIPAPAHNALIGCLKCQYTCPGDEDAIKDFWDLGEVSEVETAALLSGKAEGKLEQSLRDKLKRIGGGDNLPYIARNLKLLLKAWANR